MATAPRKRRVEEEAGDDEQPRAKEMRPADDVEMPEDDGLPLVQFPPCLQPNGRAWLLFHMGRHHQEAILDEDREQPANPPARALLVNRSFLDAFFDSTLFGPAKIWLDSEGVWSLEKFICCVAYAKTAEGVATLLHFAHNATSLSVERRAYPENVDFVLLRQWMRVAANLRALPSLSSIRLTTCGLDYPHANFFLDSLPDCVTHLKADSLRIATLIRKRATPLEAVEFGEAFVMVGQNGEPSGDRYLADVFRLKSRQIELSVWTREETQLRVRGPLDRNEHLEELHISVDINAVEDVDLPQTLRQLRAINGHFKLTCRSESPVEIRDLDVLGQMQQIVANSKLLAEGMREAGFQANGGEMRVLIKEKREWKKAPRRSMLDRLKWKREGKIPWPGNSELIPTGSLAHHGVRILFGLG